MTIILFAELAKRSYSELKQQEIFLLYYMAGAALATPFQGLLWNQYLVQSDAARMLVARGLAHLSERMVEHAG